MRTLFHYVAMFCFLGILGRAHAQVVEEQTSSGPKVDVVLLQDESLSMKRTDPFDLRRLASLFLADNLDIAGEGNRIGLILFGSTAVRRVDLSRDFGAIRRFAEEGLREEVAFGPLTCLNEENVPVRDYTDMYAALKEAERLLTETEETGGKESRKRYVVLLTDGGIDPWPGNLTRFGDLAESYLSEIKEVFPPEQRRPLKGLMGRKINDRYGERIRKSDLGLIREEILGKFREKGWRINVFGFSEGADLELIRELSELTNGKRGIAKDYTELGHLLGEIIPRAENIITLKKWDFCDVRKTQHDVTIQDSIQAVTFRVDLSDMVSRQQGLKRENLAISLTAPDGSVVRFGSGAAQEQGGFQISTNRLGQVLLASYQVNNPAPGSWNLTVEGVGSDICGQAEITVRREQKVSIELAPAKEEYFEGDKVTVSVFLEGKGGQVLPSRDVKGKVKLPTGTGSRELQFRPAPSREYVYETELTMNAGPGSYILEVTIQVTDEAESRVDSDRMVKVVPLSACSLVVNPTKVTLPKLGFSRSETQSGEISVSLSEFPKESKLTVDRPVLEKGAARIPLGWIALQKSGETIFPGRPYVVSLSVSMPKHIPRDMTDGVYRGDLPLFAECASGPTTVQIEVPVELPVLEWEPESIRFDFGFMLSRPREASLVFRSNANQDVKLSLALPEALKGRDRMEERIKMQVKGRDGLLASEVLPKQKSLQVDVVATLDDARLDPGVRIPPGTYLGEFLVEAEYGRPAKIPVEVYVPERPAIKTVVRILPVFALLSLGVAVLQIFRMIHAGKSGSFTGSKRI